MRYRLMATYREVLYQAGVGPTDKDVVLFAALPPPEGLGFQPATGHWRKAVSRAEVDAVWESRPSGSFGGEPCLVLDDLGEHLHISYLGHDLSRAERLGYSQVEPGVFEMLAAREDVTGITENRVDHPFLPHQQTWPSADTSVEPATEPWVTDTHAAPATEPWVTDTHAAPATEPWVTDTHAAPATEPWVTDTHAEPGAEPGPAIPFPAAGTAAAAAAIPEVTPPDTTVPDTTVSDATVSPATPSEAATLITRQSTRQRRAAGRPPRAQTRQVFAELADLAAIPRDAYAVDEAVNGAICLVGTESGFEVFSAADGVKQEVRLFYDEEAAYFYLFGLLTAEAVRDGRLVPPPS